MTDRVEPGVNAFCPSAEEGLDIFNGCVAGWKFEDFRVSSLRASGRVALDSVRVVGMSAIDAGAPNGRVYPCGAVAGRLVLAPAARRADVVVSRYGLGSLHSTGAGCIIDVLVGLSVESMDGELAAPRAAAAACSFRLRADLLFCIVLMSL